MDGVHTPMGLGMAPSLLGIQFALAGTVSVLPAALGGLTMMAAGTTEMTEPLVRRLTWFNAVWVAGYFAVNLRYQVPPPVISGVLIEAVLVLRLLKG
ncbi:MAG TPA: hypothetical protein VH879_15055 [Gemmatimonadales bacterium]